jgi:hypothetical protein
MTKNLRFSQNYIITWLPALCSVIRDEQQACLAGNLNGERKYYSNYIAKLSSERIAVIALTEIMSSFISMASNYK